MGRKHSRAQRRMVCHYTGKPFVAARESAFGPLVQESAWVGFIGLSTDVLEAPLKREDAAVIVLRPAAVFIATDCLLEPTHRNRTIEYRDAAPECQIGANGRAQGAPR